MWSVLPPILQEHRDRHPNVVFRLHELLMAGEHLDALTDGTLDAALVRPVGRFRNLAFEPLLREQFVAVLPEHHPLATRDVVALGELAEERFVLMPGAVYPEAHELYQRACVDAGFIPTILDQGDAPNALHMVRIGFGVALAPASVESLRLPGITIKPLKDPTPEVELAIAYREDNQSETLRTLLSTARDVARAHEDALGLSAPGRSRRSGAPPGR
jgi:DNA-binding transcriptional LysR family regulator